MSTYEWHIDVRRLNKYGDRIEGIFPTTILAATRSEVTEKVRAAFEAKYDDFRKFWSHDWTLREVREIPPATDHTAARAAINPGRDS